MSKVEEEKLKEGLFAEDSSDFTVASEDEDQKEPKREIDTIETVGSLISSTGKSWAPAIRITILGLICVIAVSVRVFSIIRYESVIHEFDPWFNFRATKVLTEKGYYAFRYWFDHESWYPLGRYSGATLFPGLMLTAWVSHSLFKYVFLFPLDIREICVFTAPVFSAFTAMTTYLLAKEVTGKSEAGLFSALFISVIPTYLSR